MIHSEWSLLLFFLLGVGLFILLRAYTCKCSPNFPQQSYGAFFAYYSVPILVHLFINLIFFAAFFTPGAVDKIIAATGWTAGAGFVDWITHYWWAAAGFGFIVDPITGTFATKIPWFKDIPPLPSPLPSQPDKKE